jgi:hypothetical protein
MYQFKVGDKVKLKEEDKFKVPEIYRNITFRVTKVKYLERGEEAICELSPGDYGFFFRRLELAKINFNSVLNYLNGKITSKEDEQRIIEFYKSTTD